MLPTSYTPTKVLALAVIFFMTSCNFVGEGGAKVLKMKVKHDALWDAMLFCQI